VCERERVCFFFKRERECTFFGDRVCVFLSPRIKALFPPPWSCLICVCVREHVFDFFFEREYVCFFFGVKLCVCFLSE